MKAITKTLRVAICGVGTVGGGVAQILAQNAELLTARCGGRSLDLIAVADQRPLNELEEELKGHLNVTHYSDAMKMVEEEDLDVIVETIGGYTVALNVCGTALEKGVSITDGCINFETTEKIIMDFYNSLD